MESWGGGMWRGRGSVLSRQSKPEMSQSSVGRGGVMTREAALVSGDHDCLGRSGGMVVRRNDLWLVVGDLCSS